MSDNITISPIPPAQTASIRHRVLWPSIPVNSQLLRFDTLPSTAHYGAFTASDRVDPIACLTITLEQYHRPSTLPLWITEGLPPSAPHYQLHKFAVLPAYQSRGVGKRLLSSAIDSIQRKLAEEGVKAFLFHFDARSTQMELYKHLGFRVLDEERFMKYGSTSKGPGVEYVRMGRLVHTAAPP